MSDPGQALLRGVLEAPDEDPPRLVYADYLMERDDPRGEFISVQVQLCQRINPARRKRLRTRERELWYQHRKTFDDPARTHKLYSKFRRGFMDFIAAAGAAFAEHGPALMEIEPVRRVRLSQIAPEHIEAMTTSGVIGRLMSISVYGSLGVEGARALATPQLESVRHLNLGNAELDDEAVAALVDSGHLHATTLGLHDNELTDAAIEALLAWPGLAQCERLYLSRNQITDAGLESLVTAALPRFERLQRLCLGGNEDVSEAGALAFATEAAASAIHGLELDQIELTDEARQKLRDVWGDRVRVDENYW